MQFSDEEQKILNYWLENKVFEKSITSRKGRPRFVFFEGPPTANGRPGIHHILVRSLKDAFSRYKTMRGFLVERKAGWDTHGLPVEIGVEKELGFRTKQDIENYGIAQFNAKAKESVWRYKDEWERLTDRIGFWLDLKNPYVTYHNSYIESVWWILKQIWGRNLLQKDFKVVPYCTRCGTALASHEVAQGYESVTENSVYLKFKLKSQLNTFILSWTTTPWTLPSNVALAIGEDIDYVKIKKVKVDGVLRILNTKDMGEHEPPKLSIENYILAKTRLSIITEPYEIIEEMKGKDLVGLEYEPLFNIPETQNEKSHKVYAADFVTTEDGTGVVHTAVMYGEDDYTLGNEVGLPKVHTVGENGKFLNFVPAHLAGLYVKSKETEAVIITYLQQHNFFLKEEMYTHDYPFCWRCKTPLLYYARQSWFIKISQLRKELQQANETVNWVPEHIKEGRFGEWLKEVKDWGISRERYWGTPLPVWECESCKTIEAMGSVKELLSRSKSNNQYILVRHAEAKSNIEEWISTWPELKDDPLTQKGIQQANDAGKRIATLKPDIILTSPLQRTLTTAQIIGEYIDVAPHIEQDLREFDLSTFNTRPIQEYHDFLDNDPSHRWDKKPLDGENWEDLRSRMYALLLKLEKTYSGKTIVLVSHGDPLLLFKGIVMGAEGKDVIEHYVRSTAPQANVISYPEYAVEEVLPKSLPPLDEHGRIDLHRPYIDTLKFECRKCEGSMKRASEVIDVWLDSGAMPFAQWHYPFENIHKIDAQARNNPEFFPADFICEAVDQTRGWFYTLMAISVLLEKGAPYKNVVVTGHVVDKNGKKMSKSLGNAVDPWEMIDKYGADAIRWYFFTMNQPGDTKRFNEQELKEVQQKFLGTLWNSFSFYELYAVQDAHIADSVASENVLDQWVLSRVATVSEYVQQRMDAYDVTAAARALNSFVIDDLSNWYIRRSRDRFQHPVSNEDLELATKVFGWALQQTALLVAPFVPFVAESIWTGLGKKESVHLAELPQLDKNLKQSELESAMEALRAKIQVALKLRAQAGHKVRQPLGTLVFTKAVAEKDKLDEKLFYLLREELNIENIQIVDVLPGRDNWLCDEQIGMALDTTITPTLQLLGFLRELLRQIQATRKDAGLKPKEEIILRFWATEKTGEDLMQRAEEIKADVYAQKVEVGEKRHSETFIIEREFDLGDSKVWLGIKRAN